MIIQFLVRNFKAFKDEAVLNMAASNYDKADREEENVIHESAFDLRLLKSAVIYGPNASGKSRFLEAIMFMRNFVIRSAKDWQSGDAIPVDPFRLNSVTRKEGSEFEMTFIDNGELFRYGFELDSEKVIAEWLYHRPKTKEIEIFTRDFQEIGFHKTRYKGAKMLVDQDMVRENALFLSVAAQFNLELSKRVVNWFKKLQVISGLKEEGYHFYTMTKTQEAASKGRILDLVQRADLGITNISTQTMDVNNLPDDMPVRLKEMVRKKIREENAEFLSDVETTHKTYDDSRNHVDTTTFSLDDDESSGTKKFFALTGPILEVLDKGHILVVDEFDSKLHPNLACKLIELFNSKKTNKNNAQLIFNTHNTNMLRAGLFRRDQIWFTEKNRYGEAKLYSLADFKTSSVRKEENYEDKYIQGKYGAVPYTEYFNELLKNTNGA